VASLSHGGYKDEQLLPAIAAAYPGAVLVTSDDNMPAVHAEVLRQTRVTLATIAPQRDPGHSADEWDHEIVHRWAHRMETQSSSTIKRYSLSGGRTWRLRTRQSPTK